MWHSALLTAALAAVLAFPARAQSAGDSAPTDVYARHDTLYDGRPASYWVTQLHERAPQERSAAAYALSGIGPAAASAVPELIGTLADESPNVRWAAAWALGEIGPGASSALPALSRMSKEDEHGSVQWAAKKAMRKIRREGGN